MSVPSWQTRCGEVNGYDHEAGSECHAPIRELEIEFDVVDGATWDWLYDHAAIKDCAEKLCISSFNRWGVMRNHRKPANDNGRES